MFTTKVSASAAKDAKMGTIAVVVASEDWIETFSDEREIERLEDAIAAGDEFPLEQVYAFRTELEREDDDFGDYVEELLSQRFTRPDIQEHGVAWLKSKAKIEKFRDQERDAAEVIADYALKKYKEDPALTDFVLAGPGVQVRIRIFHVSIAPGSAGIAA